MTRVERAPAPLLLGAAVVMIEGLALVVYGLAQLSALGDGRVTMVVTSAFFFLVYGAGLVAFGWLLTRIRSWARAPVVLAQLIQLGVAWSFRGGSTTALATLLAVLAGLVLASLIHPASTRAMDRADHVGG